jgi:uncharacterized membrane protein
MNRRVVMAVAGVLVSLAGGAAIALAAHEESALGAIGGVVLLVVGAWFVAESLD